MQRGLQHTNHGDCSLRAARATNMYCVRGRTAGLRNTAPNLVRESRGMTPRTWYLLKSQTCLCLPASAGLLPAGLPPAGLEDNRIPCRAPSAAEGVPCRAPSAGDKNDKKCFAVLLLLLLLVVAGQLMSKPAAREKNNISFVQLLFLLAWPQYMLHQQFRSSLNEEG